VRLTAAAGRASFDTSPITSVNVVHTFSERLRLRRLTRPLASSMDAAHVVSAVGGCAMCRGLATDEEIAGFVRGSIAERHLQDQRRCFGMMGGEAANDNAMRGGCANGHHPLEHA
jgi:hypothetical protein